MGGASLFFRDSLMYCLAAILFEWCAKIITVSFFLPNESSIRPFFYNAFFTSFFTPVLRPFYAFSSAFSLSNCPAFFLSFFSRSFYNFYAFSAFFPFPMKVVPGSYGSFSSPLFYA